MNSTSPSRDVGRFRKLRIAFSVTCLVACVLLIALWVRSYWCVDMLIINGVSPFEVVSVSGSVAVTVFSEPGSNAVDGWQYKCNDIPQENYLPTYLGFAHGSTPTYSFIEIPLWLMVLLFIALVAAPWLPWRFSLRTLLIATTLVAVGLGLTVWLR